jgi:aspartyl-tRNA(Asn)/glutamyl-tRNA(Gln) amidotransferase subunit A
MRSESWAFESIEHIGYRYRDGTSSCLDITENILNRIGDYDPKLQAYVTVIADEALETARRLHDELVSGSDRGPLHGIPIAVKDLVETAGIRTTAGSKILADYIPKRDATVVARLKDAGAIILGKTTTHEFAYGIHSPPTRNPWESECTPGGSSGGSAAAVAAGLACGAIGTDTGGSIRIPSSLCGVTGIKPTYGRVSRAGVIVLSWSLDHIGPITRSAKDASLVLRAIAGEDPRDPSTTHRTVDDVIVKDGESLSNLRIGIPTSYFYEPLNSDVRDAVETSLKVFQDRGAELLDITIPSIENTLPAEWAIVLPEATLYHEKYLKTQPEEYDPEVRSDLEQGKFILATDYLKGQQFRRRLGFEFQEVFRQVDIIATPTMPIPAPRVDQEWIDYENSREDVRTALIRLACPFNLTGLPTITVPCGFSRANLPIGLQLAGPSYKEKLVLQVAHSYQEETSWHKSHPPAYP